MQHSFRWLLRKNLLYMTFPVVIILAAILLLLFQVSRLEDFQYTVLEDTGLIGQYYDSGQRNISITLRDLRSAGFSETVEGTEKAQYYYFVENNRMQLVLLEPKTVKEYRTSVKGELTVKVRIEKDLVTARHVESAYAESLGLSSEEMQGFCNIYLLDETGYPALRILFLRIASYGLSVILGLLMLYVILATMVPALNYQARVLKHFGPVGRMIRKLDREMNKKLKYHQDNVTVTANFLIVSYLSRIDVVKIDEIKYLSKHIEKRKRGLARPVHVYRLTASNADDLYFEADFFDEEIINDVIYYMRGEPILEYEENLLKSKEAEENEPAKQQDALFEEPEE